LIGEFHLGVPENGLGSGLVQAKDQTERGIGYRYYVEQAVSLPYSLGAHWFAWRDEPVLGRMDGENYNIGFVDVTDRPYPELVEAAKPRTSGCWRPLRPDSSVEPETAGLGRRRAVFSLGPIGPTEFLFP
jgi:hypothetical protein